MNPLRSCLLSQNSQGGDDPPLFRFADVDTEVTDGALSFVLLTVCPPRSSMAGGVPQHMVGGVVWFAFCVSKSICCVFFRPSLCTFRFLGFGAWLSLFFQWASDFEHEGDLEAGFYSEDPCALFVQRCK